MMRAADLAALLADRAEDVAAMLLPNGKRKGREWCVGSIGGDEGDSLKVHLGGGKSGVWQDFATGEGGDLIDLWAAVRNLTLAQAFAEVRDYLGIREHRVENPRKVYARPTKEGVTALPPQIGEWLQTVRKITPDTAKAFKLASRKGALMFPYLRDGELVAAKYRKVPAKEFFVDADCEPCLFGWQALSGKEREVVLCEGEMDALAFCEYGIAALSVPFGGGKGAKQSQWIEAEFDRLAIFDTLFLAMDDDGPGAEATAEIVKRLGRERCRIVTLPRKDANECLMHGITQAEMDKALITSKTLDPEQLHQASEFCDDLVAAFQTKIGYEYGIRLPFAKAGNSVILRPEEVSIWLGVNGHGKALCLDTPIATPAGWKRLGNIGVGDQVFDERGMPCNVVWQSHVQIGRPCYRVKFSDGTEIIADAEHEWLTHSARARASARGAKKHRTGTGTDQRHKRALPSIVTTRDIAETLMGVGSKAHLFNHSIPTCGALQLQEKKLPIDPYILGAWLGDGSSADSGITSADEEVIEQFTNAGYEVVKGAAKYRYGIRGGLYSQLRTSNQLLNKHVPRDYVESSVAQRLALLQGLMDTDGHITTYGRCEFSNRNRQIAESVLEIVLSLGVQANMLCGRATLYGKDCGEKYRVTFTPDFPAFRLTRKLERQAISISDRAKHRFIISCDPVASVPVKCIEVDSQSHLFLAGESLIATHNSQGMGQVTLGALVQDFRCCVASMEHRPVMWLKRMVRQATANENPSEAYIRHVAQWFHDKLWVFNAVGTAKADQILEVFAYAARRYRVRYFLIDNLAKCGFAEDDYNGQKNFVDRLSDFAKEYGVHVALVHHLRKGESEDKPGGKMDAKGTGAITDMASTCAVWWRNKPKEKKVKAAQGKGLEPDAEIQGKPDALLIFDKQNNGEAEPTFALWFDQPSLQFLEYEHARPHQFVGFSTLDGRARTQQQEMTDG